MTDPRQALHSKALRAYPNAYCIRDAITMYLFNLHAYSTEWSEWLEEYTEGELIEKFGANI